jgi:hypothetical protein
VGPGLVESRSGKGRGRRPNNRVGPWQVTFLEIYEKRWTIARDGSSRSIATAQSRRHCTFRKEETAMPTRKPNKKRRPAGSRGKTPRARAVPSKRKKRSPTKQLARTGSPARATKKVHTKRAAAKHAKVTSTKARAGTQTVTRKASAAIAHAVSTVRKAIVGAATGAAKGAVTGAVHGAMTAVTPEPSPAGAASTEER